MITIAKKYEYLIPIDSVIAAIDFLNTLDWNLSTSVSDGVYKLFGGDQLIITAPNKDELNSFLLGMALGLGVLPDKVLEEARKAVR